MNPIVRSVILFFLLYLILRFSGKRTLAQISTFDTILILIISGATQKALISNDFSLINFLLLIVSLVGITYFLNFLEIKSPLFDQVGDGLPLILVKDGKFLRERMKKVQVSEGDILESARLSEGSRSIENIKYAILERGGKISIISKIEI